jgi:formyl-CoA transferase
MALWAFLGDVGYTLATGQQPPSSARSAIQNPIRNFYGTKDGRWLLLAMPRYEAYWPGVAQAIGRPELAGDPRYSTLAAAQERLWEMVALLEDAFQARTLAEWRPLLDEQQLIWAPALEIPEVLADPQVKEMGYIQTFDHPERGRVETVAAPFRLSAVEARPRGPAPEVGQHTEEVLLELGYTWDEIGALREGGALG